MYTPEKYTMKNLAEIRSFIRANSFGILISQVNGKPWATHIPMQLETDTDGNDILVSHIARANEQWKHFSETDEVLCIFNGPHSYISSSWYKEEEVPTWNYLAAHVYGTLKILSEIEVLESMHRMVNHYEKDVEHPINLNHFSEQTLRQVRGVVGFKISITNIQATKKLSQSRQEDHSTIIAGLEKRDASAKAVAKEMKT